MKPERLERARRLASRARLLIIYGPAGTGKTTLLEALASEWRGQAPVVYVDGALGEVVEAPSPSRSCWTLAPSP